jgi:hypothetical protein
MDGTLTGELLPAGDDYIYILRYGLVRWCRIEPIGNAWD